MELMGLRDLFHRLYKCYERRSINEYSNLNVYIFYICYIFMNVIYFCIVRTLSAFCIL